MHTLIHIFMWQVFHISEIRSESYGDTVRELGDGARQGEHWSWELGTRGALWVTDGARSAPGAAGGRGGLGAGTRRACGQACCEKVGRVARIYGSYGMGS